MIVTSGCSVPVGVDFIDEEHDLLFTLIDRLGRSMRAGGDHAVVTETLETIARYAAEHFAHEEAEMLRSGYPDRENHVALHRGMLADLHDLERRQQAGEHAVSVGVSQFLHAWLDDHIRMADRALALWLRAQ